MAARIAVELRRTLGLDVRLLPGAEREFTVRIDGRVVFSRADRGRFPTPDEMLELVSARSSRAAPHPHSR